MDSYNYYYDNAATSFPKPKEVALAMSLYINNCGGTYGRAAYRRVVDATLHVEECRDSLSELLKCDSEAIFFTHNATHGANLILNGLDLTKDDIFAVSPLEHNAVMRPLEALSQKLGIKWCVLPHFSDGLINTTILDDFLTENKVNHVIINHQSNVNGLIQPLEQICNIAKKHNIQIIVDATQSVGIENINLEVLNLDYMFFTGHKNLHGPMGVGAVYIKDISRIKPLILGGTGSNSDSYIMPIHAPDLFEAGTPNIPSIVGLNAALNSEIIPKHTKEDFIGLIKELKKCVKLTLFCASDLNQQGEVISLTHKELNVSQFSDKLYRDHKIEVRSGLHCSPLAHRSLGTFPSGTVRISLSCYHTKEDLNYLLNALKSI